MNRIVIGGISDSEEFVIGFGLVNLASKKYPTTFLYDFHDMLTNEYWRWLDNMNKENGWKHKGNFIAWHEYRYGGPKYLIGPLELFTEYMFEEYSVRVDPSPAKLERLCEAFKEAKKEKLLKEAKKQAERHIRRVSVIHENHPGVGIMCREILNNALVVARDGMELVIFNLEPDVVQSVSLHDDLVSMHVENLGVRSVKIAKSLKHALKNCHLLIFMGNDTTIAPSLPIELKVEAAFWSKMGQAVDKYARNAEDMKVVFTCMNYPCFNATLFVHASRRISYDLVIAITHHISLQPLVYVSRASGIPLAHMMHQTAHVWGSPGISHLANLENTDFLFNTPTLPFTEKEAEKLKDEINWKDGNPFDRMEMHDDWTWRKLDYLVSYEWAFEVGDTYSHLKYFWFYVGQEKELILQRQRRQPYITAIRATMDILSAWYDFFLSKTPFTVGVFSTGLYGVPAGLIFSTPALMRDDMRRGWYQFEWSEISRQAFRMDRRPRWNAEGGNAKCIRRNCTDRQVDRRICCHHRNPDIFLPEDPLLSLQDVIRTVITMFHAIDGTGEILSQLLEPGEMNDALIKNITDTRYFEAPPVVDDYAANVRKKANEIRKKWEAFFKIKKDEPLPTKKPVKSVHQPEEATTEEDHVVEKEEDHEDNLAFQSQISHISRASRFHEPSESEHELLDGEEAVPDDELDHQQIQNSLLLPSQKITSLREARKMAKEKKQAEESDEQLKKLLDSIQPTDLPMFTFLKNMIPGDMLTGEKRTINPDDPFSFLEDTEFMKSAEAAFSKMEHRPARQFLQEFMAERAAKIDRFIKEEIPSYYGHLYYEEGEEERMRELDKIRKREFKKSIPNHFPKFNVWHEFFEPPPREPTEDQRTYDVRCCEAYKKYADRQAMKYLNRPPGSIRIEGDLWGVLTVSDSDEEGKSSKKVVKSSEERMNETTEEEIDEETY